MTKNILTIKNLLSRVKSISKKYEELEKLKGENFNVFQIFDMERDENKMHSRFIETLLNPKGPHGLGSVFLEQFLSVIKFGEYFKDIKRVNTRVEHPIGKVNLENATVSGGRIDIYIWDNEKSISIENKINAGDQEKQIVRYSNHNKDGNQVFYLTLDGKEPSNSSKGKLISNLESDNPDFYCISYSETIISWLYKCQKEASDLPIIRETIKQYIIAIKRLTGQLTNQKMKKEILNLIASNYDDCKLISDNLYEAELEATTQFINEVAQKLKDQFSIDEWEIIVDEDLNKSYTGIKLRNINWANGVHVKLEGNSKIHRNNSTCGIVALKKDFDQASIREALKSLTNKYNKDSNVWALYHQENDFSKKLSKLFNETERERLVNQLYEDLSDIAMKSNDFLKTLKMTSN